MSRIRKLYIDSRARSSGTDSDFDVVLPEVIECSPSQVVYVTGVTFPNVFYTVETGIDDRFYAIITVTASGQTTSQAFYYTIPPGNYSGADFATALASGFQTSGQIPTQQPAFSYVSRSGQLLIVMAPGTTIRLPTDAELLNPAFITNVWNACTTHIAFTGLQSLNEVLRNAGTSSAGSSFRSNLLTLRPFPTVYLYSDIASYDSTDCFKRPRICVPLARRAARHGLRRGGREVLSKCPCLPQGLEGLGRESSWGEPEL